MGCGLTKNDVNMGEANESMRSALSGQKNSTIAVGGEEGAAHVPGKEKYIKSYGAVVMDTRSKDGSSVCSGILILFCAKLTDDVVFSYRDSISGLIFAKRLNSKELCLSKEAAGIPFSWGSFFKSLASDILKNKAVVQNAGKEKKEVRFTIVSSKQPEVKYTYNCLLDMISREGDVTQQEVLFEYFIEPMTRMLQARRNNADLKNQVDCSDRLECEHSLKSASIKHYQARVAQLAADIRPLRKLAAVKAQDSAKLTFEVKSLERHLYSLYSEQSVKHPLDLLYERGGAQQFLHLPYAEKHRPVEEKVDQAILTCIRAAFPLPPGAKLDSIINILERQDLQELLDNSNRQLARDMFEIFRAVDRWDCDTILLDIITNGNALFYMTYMLLYKLNLVSHFHLDDNVLQRFLAAVQAGYHPNPYHNAMHAADVTQINYYIIIVAGLREKCCLSHEELLASLLAGAVHDFDHPGLNNNFHTKTNAYLSTLYNDRSVLENHHVACIFELLQHPEYNVFAPLNAEQLRVVRDVMIEMVLATDMGRHATIFNKFRVRMSEETDWSSSKKDVFLALSMSIKMADISNCARPNYIYAEWAQNIAREFYNQGDAEAACGLPISPFMNRKNEVTEFPKGQISFMMYIVVPMVEAISEFLPSLRFALQHCSENKVAWQSYQEENF